MRGRGGYTDPHGKLKEMVVCPLGRSSVARLCATEPHPDWAVARTAVDVTEETLPSLLEALQRVPDFRHAQGRRHKLRLPDLELERVSCFCTREVGLGDFSG